MGTIPLFPIGLANDKRFYLKDRLRKGRVCSEAASRKGFACVNPHHFRVQELPKNEVRASHTEIGRGIFFYRS
jgi:hypothetical protein